MYRAAAFRDYFMRTIAGTKNSADNYNSYLNRIDKAVGGLDEKIRSEGIDSVRAWSRTTKDGPFEKYPSDSRSILKSYLDFTERMQMRGEPNDQPEAVQDSVEATGTVFRVEKEMQTAVRKQLTMLEPGLREADGGLEVSIATGRVDILAEDANGQLVVIELKAGVCPSGALEQTLGYAEALAEERRRPVRAFLVAAEFPERTRAAARRTRDLELRTYEFSLRFHNVS